MRCFRLFLFTICTFAFAPIRGQQYGLEVELVTENVGVLVGALGVTDLTGYSCTRVYATTMNSDDFLSRVYGNSTAPTFVETTTNFYHAALGSGTPNGINSLLFPVYPDLAYDSWVTIGLEGAPNALAGEANVSTAQATDNPWMTNFDPGGGLPGANIAIDDIIGGAWYALNGDANGVAGDDLKVLVGQFTTTGSLSGQLHLEFFAGGNESNLISSTCGFLGLTTDCGVNGCLDPLACNYNLVANSPDGSCLVPPDGGECCSAGLFISEFSEGVGYDTFLELFNASQDTLLLDGFVLARTANQLNPEGGFDFFDIVFPADATLAPGETYVIAESGAALEIVSEADLLVPEISSGDDALGLINPTGVVVDQIGIPGVDEGNGWTVNGVENATYNGTIRRVSGVHDGNGGDWTSTQGQSGNSEWQLVEEDVLGDIGQHTIEGSCYGPSDFLIRGCAYAGAVNYDTTATASVMAMCVVLGCTDEGACNFFFLATVDDGGCDYTCIGCTDATACNYDVIHTIDDGGCDYSCIGCTDSSACNYSTAFTIDDGSCTYDCIGCTDSFACNYLESYTVDDGSCEYETCLGCTDPDGCNFDENAVYDNGSCQYGSCAGCTDPEACNYSPDLIFDDGSCEYPMAGFDCDCNCLEDADGDGICDDDSGFQGCIPLIGCTDDGACNYNSMAEDDDGSCEYPLWGFDCDCQCLNDLDDDGFCDEFYGVDGCGYLGCMDEEACNFDVSATVDDGGCFFLDECGVCGGGGVPDGQCDCEGNVEDALGECGGDCASDQDEDGVCDVDEVIGCQNPLACNYDPEATDPGTCYSPVVVSGVVVVDCSGEFTSQVGNALCGPGTYWDDQWNGCLAYEDCASDVDGDGLVGINDLLNLLADFATACD